MPDLECGTGAAVVLLAVGAGIAALVAGLAGLLARARGRRRRDELMAVLAHELRTPLTAMRNALAVLVQAAPGGEQAGQARAILDRQTAHLACLAEGLLEAAGLDAEQLQLATRAATGEAVRLPARPLVSVAAPAAALRLRVLIVEDNEDCAAALRELLQLQGHDAVVARDGETGLVAARSWDPDVVLCDLGLPGLDGYEVARRLRAGGSRARLVAHTACARSCDVERAQRAGFDDHLAKPADLDQLAAALAAWAVERVPRAPAAAVQPASPGPRSAPVIRHP